MSRRALMQKYLELRFAQVSEGDCDFAEAPIHDALLLECLSHLVGIHETVLNRKITDSQIDLFAEIERLLNLPLGDLSRRDQKLPEKAWHGRTLLAPDSEPCPPPLSRCRLSAVWA